MENKQTAIQWLHERFNKYVGWVEGDYLSSEYTLTQLCNDFHEAEKMERDQIIDAHYEGQCDNTEGYPKFISEQYYNEIYGN